MTIKTVAGFTHAMHMSELQGLLMLLVKAKALPRNDAIKLTLGLAEKARSVETSADLRGHADVVAQHYEDVAAVLGGGRVLPRDPTD